MQLLRHLFVYSLLIAGALSAGAQSLTADAFEQQVKQLPAGQLLDVRTPGEFGGGHLPGAKNLDFRNPDFGKNLASLDKKKPVYVYCLSGGRSTEAAKLMREQGFTSVYELQGGYLKWTTRMKPIEGAQTKSSAKAVTPAELQTWAASNRLVLVDFYAPWCAPCQKMMPIIDQLQTQYAGKVLVVKADADASKALMQAYQIDEIPTLLVIKQGKLSERLIGLQTTAYLTELLDKNL
ncbi:thioredoxin domain-containing protein [Spirosoma utsteinense]|uniref:Thioredoxin n=1 Tax=Spirosoma utsteinense TaxID=2585773 RepID=A0ABR6W966_9BACT|nr:thioredoxin domain-containing protein [Spirosoma utsteinense]MBC3787333.1 thioredoxin [Spirosoma utsteinense]MBC3793113.1 thioredoxin [Spirosoma utsteinense]